ncbi:hypothetical protein [Hymenobacter persicinus]|uniref:Uncharacterized protein n=1 Tax=Hymenobacter persicinus TaxID=2025506 RepID=A0A4Q5LAG8_9BACT|nr:hypothetical protein [Hymenobacter persicinus]RYU78942.1 hypothetical protein EWM57_12220 [Hymenobacter persicinus]
MSSKVGPTQEDSAFMLVQDNGQPRISSLSSAIQTQITKQEMVGDTLLVTYKRGAFLGRTRSWTRSRVPLNEQTTTVQCANRRFRVVKTDQGFALEPLK